MRGGMVAPNLNLFWRDNIRTVFPPFGVRAQRGGVVNCNKKTPTNVGWSLLDCNNTFLRAGSECGSFMRLGG